MGARAVRGREPRAAPSLPKLTSSLDAENNYPPPPPTCVKGAVERRVSVWHLMGTYVGGLLLLILMSHYLPPFYHVPGMVTSVSQACFPVLTAAL